jgi:hypothetical protein
VLPDFGNRVWSCELSGRTFETGEIEGKIVLDVGTLFDVLPVALLTSTSQ